MSRVWGPGHSRSRVRSLALTTLALLALLLAVLLPAGGDDRRPATLTAPGISVVPAQFVAKMYTEALGRGPDPGGWRFWLDVFRNGGCSLQTTSEVARRFYTSSEFLDRGYDMPARVLALYRGTLNRDPDQGGFDHWTNALGQGTSWSELVELFIGSHEFADLTAAMCGGRSSSYGYGSHAAPTLPVSGTGFAGGTGEQLQGLLDQTPAGGTVYLAQKAVVRVSAMLDIPAGVTLTTTGAPPPARYALQGRLVRASSFAAPLVRLESGAHLQNVWVDGQMGNPSRYVLEAINVQTMGGTGTEVAGNKIANSAGWSNVQVFGSYEGLPCASTSVTGNLVTGYSSSHYAVGGQTHLVDGLSVACENAVVRGNTIIDATDVGIVVFRARPAVQRTQVTGNYVISAGNPAFGGMGIDSGHSHGAVSDFTGLAISGNHLWTGPDTHFDIGLVVGVRPWFGVRVDRGTGGRVTDNTSDGLAARVATGIAVSGLDNATVRGNTIQFSVLSSGVVACPHVAIGIDADGFAQGVDVQRGGVRVSFLHPQGGGWGCIGLHDP